MQRVNLLFWFHLAAAADGLASIREGDSFAQTYPMLEPARLIILLTSYKTDALVRLNVSAVAALHLFQLAERLRKDPQRTDPITRAEAEEIRKAVADYRLVCEAELPTVDNVYALLPKGAFALAQLVDNADIAVGQEALVVLDDNARGDLRAAGRCLAFELSTAAGFHVARAVEAVIRSLMTAYGCASSPASQRNWGAYIKTLSDAGAPQMITHHLEQIKDLHRNPLIHPELSLSMVEALALWSVCISLITAMAAEIKSKLAAAPAAPASP